MVHLAEPEGLKYLESIRRLVADINLKHEAGDWQPMRLSLEGDLDEVAGAHEELGELAVTLHPSDIQHQADAFFEALTMGREESRDRMSGCGNLIWENDVAKWLRDQLHHVRQLREACAR